MTKLKFILLPLFVLACISDALGQNNERKKFTLNGHEFVPSSLVQSASVQTSLMAKLSLGSTGLLDAKGIILNDTEILSFTGSILFAGGKVMYNQKVNSWFSMYLDFEFGGRVGTQIPTLLVEGVNTASGSELGWVFKLYEHPKGMLSGTLFSNRYGASIVNITQYIEEVIEGNPRASLINKVPLSLIGARLQYAHAFNKIWGVQCDASYGYGEAPKRNKLDVYMDLGVFVDANLYAEKNIPLGFGLGYSLTSKPETSYNEESLANVFFANIMYVKASDFELGLELSYYSIPLSNYKSTPYVFSAGFLMRFNF